MASTKINRNEVALAFESFLVDAGDDFLPDPLR
jgi:hypothetical protein